MRAISHRLKGLDALRLTLRSLPATAEGAVAPAIQSVAETVADDVRTALRDTVLQDKALGDRAGRLAAVSVDQTAGGSSVTVRSPFARALEYGTLHMAARPFLRPVALRAGQAARTWLAIALRQGLTP